MDSWNLHRNHYATERWLVRGRLGAHRRSCPTLLLHRPTGLAFVRWACRGRRHARFFDRRDGAEAAVGRACP